METVKLIEKWAEDRNFFGEGGADLKGQFVKLAEEAGADLSEFEKPE